MPWSVSDVDKHNKGLSDKKKRQWVHVANAILGKTGNEGKAVKIANGAVNKSAVMRRLQKKE